MHLLFGTATVTQDDTFWLLEQNPTRRLRLIFVRATKTRQCGHWWDHRRTSAPFRMYLAVGSSRGFLWTTHPARCTAVHFTRTRYESCENTVRLYRLYYLSHRSGRSVPVCDNASPTKERSAPIIRYGLSCSGMYLYGQAGARSVQTESRKQEFQFTGVLGVSVRRSIPQLHGAVCS